MQKLRRQILGAVATVAVLCSAPALAQNKPNRAETVAYINNVIKKANGATITRLDLPDHVLHPAPRLAAASSSGEGPGLLTTGTDLTLKDAKERWNDHFERRYLGAVFELHGRNVTRAAEHAGINRRHFRELLYKHGLLDRPSGGNDDDS